MVFYFHFFEGFRLNCFHVFCESFIALTSILILLCEVATIFLIYDSIFLTEYSANQYIEAAWMYFKIQKEIWNDFQLKIETLIRFLFGIYWYLKAAYSIIETYLICSSYVMNELSRLHNIKIITCNYVT